MADAFSSLHIPLMDIHSEAEAFDSPDYLYELKIDGIRCKSRLDPGAAAGVELWSRNGKPLVNFPELQAINQQVRVRCMLDGELIVYRDGKPDFEDTNARARRVSPMRLAHLSREYPVSYVVFDILFYKDRQVTGLPLTERRALLEKAIKTETDRMFLSRVVEEQGVAFFNLTKQQGLEGVVAKRKDSIYLPGRTTKDWMKFKNWLEDDFVLCGYLDSVKNNTTRLIFGEYDEDGVLQYRGHCTLGRQRAVYWELAAAPKANSQPFPALPDASDAGAVWLKPQLVVTIRHLGRYEKGGVRQPQFKALRDDKAPADCIWRE